MSSATAKKVEVANDTKNDNLRIEKQPCNTDAEFAVIGAVLNNNESINKVGDFLKAEHFFVQLHAKIYAAIVTFYERGLIASPVTLKNYFEDDEALKEMGVSSLDYLMRLSTGAATVINLMPYAREIYEAALRRELIKIGEEVLVDAYNPKVDVSATDMIEHTEQRLFSLASEGAADGGFVNIRTSVTESIKRIEGARRRGTDVSGVTSGYIELDKLLGGMQQSDLLILAARPSMGKTSLAINIGLRAAIAFMSTKKVEERKSVGIFSLEMSSEQVVNRMLSIETGVDGSRIRIGNITKDEFDTLIQETNKLANLPIYIDDTPAITISALRTRARRLKRQHNLGLIVIDYLQLVRGTGRSSESNRVQEIGEISQGLKAIAKELDIPVMALSQLSRAVESRDDKHPQLSDLRESGNIEQDADVVMFIYREEYYLARKMPQTHDQEKYAQWQADMDKIKNIAEVIVAKQRNGPIGAISLRFDTRTTGFENLDHRA